MPNEAKNPYTITSEEPGGDISDLSNIMTYPIPFPKATLFHQDKTKGDETTDVGVFHGHHDHRGPLKGGTVDHVNHGTLANRSNPTTPSANHGERSHTLDDTELNHQESIDGITALKTDKHVPDKATDPHTITREELDGDDTGLPDLMTCPNPSIVTPFTHPHDTKLNEVSTKGPPNGKERAITTEILQISQHAALVRPSSKPPDP